MSLSAEQLVQQIHAAPRQIVLAVSGAGSSGVAELLQVPGASRTILEAVVPYSQAAMTAWLGGRPEEFCSSGTARAMAMAAFHRARKYDRGQWSVADRVASHSGESSRIDRLEAYATPAGVACTAAVATDRPKRGEHRAQTALQTDLLTATWSLGLEKDRRSRAEEERLVGRLLLNTVAEACGLEDRLELDLLEHEAVEESRTVAPQPWQELLLGKVQTVYQGGGERPARAVFPGAFNPLHFGHRRMGQIAAEVLQQPIAMEISILNVDKPPLDYFEIARRLEQFSRHQPIWLTRAATFDEKSRLFPGATFIVGADTLRRIAEPRYYGDDPAARDAAIEQIVGRDCRFLVFGREAGGGFVCLSDLDLPEELRSICREVPPERFREDVCSTEIRKSGTW